MSQPISTLPLSPKTQRFYQGVAAANDVSEAHEGTEWPSFQAQRDMFWFYVGGMAVEGGLTEPAEFADFIGGARLRAPEPQEDE